MKAKELRAEYIVGRVRPEAVTRRNIARSFSAARLGDVAESMKNGLYKPASEYGEDGAPCLRMYNIDAGEIVWRDIKRMRVTLSEMEDYGLREGDLLVNRVNSRELVGKTALIPEGLEPSVFESKNIRLRLKTDRVLPKFINYQLLAFGRQHFSSNAQQVVGMASVGQKQLADFPIVLAPLDQQKHIVAEIEKQFSRLDEAVANLKRVKANLKRYKAAVLKVAVEGRLVETEADLACREGRSFETGEQLLQRILETRRSQWQGKGKYKEPAAADTTDLPELPEGWVWATVEQLADVQLGKMLDRQKHQSGKELPYLRNINVRWDSVDSSDLLTMFFKDSELERYGLQTGDVLVCEGGEPGRAAIWDGRILGMMYQKAIHRVRFRAGYEQRLLVFYLEFLAKTGRLERWFTGSTIKHFTRESFAQLPIPVAPESEQRRIVMEVDRRFSLLRETEAQVDANLLRAGRLRQSILSRAFSGTLQ